ncbi:MAG: hypothetical protein WC852_00310 [Candidatus Nanoarchaeia archaeon]|jgi:hypothetical protein
MGIKSWLKKTGMAVSLAGALTGCDMLSPEGEQVIQDADGVLTAEEQANAEQALSPDYYANDFIPFKPLVNDFNVFMGNELVSQGLNERRFDDELHVYMVNDEAEMREKYTYGNRPWVPPAFHGDTNSTLYILKNSYIPADFIMAFTHESGHHFRSSAYEFPSKAYEMYFAFRAYGFNRRIGSLFADYASPVPMSTSGDESRRCLPVDEYFAGDYHKYYSFGDLGFLIQANLENGNLEKAFNNILTRPILYLEQTTVDAARQYGNMCEVGLGEFRKLLEKPGFRQGLLRHMSPEEANEFTDYLLINANDIMSAVKSNEGMYPNILERQEMLRNEEQFLDSYPNNPFFRGNVTEMISYGYYLNALDLLNDSAQMATNAGIVKAHKIATDIIALNKDYPCQYKFYECMGKAAAVRASQALGYLLATYYPNELIASGVETPETLILIPNEYASKFYSNGNYHYEDNNLNAAAFTPQITLFGGKVEEALATIDTTYGNMQDGITHLCNAVNWYKKTLEAGCNRIPDAEKKDECESWIDASFEQAARDKVNRSTLFYNTYCL